MEKSLGKNKKILRIPEHHRGYRRERREWSELSSSPGIEKTEVSGYLEALELEAEGFKPTETTYIIGSSEGVSFRTFYRDTDLESRDLVQKASLRKSVPCIGASIRVKNSVPEKEVRDYYQELREIEEEFHHNTRISDYLEQKYLRKG